MGRVMQRRVYRGEMTPVIRGCLDQIRRGEMTAAGVLADHLEEQGLPYAKSVRMWWDQCRRQESFWRNDEKNRRQVDRWQRIACCRNWFRHKIGRLFRRKWKHLADQKFIGPPC